MDPLPLRRIAEWALAGTLVVVALVLVDVRRTGGGNPVSLVQPGERFPSAPVFHRDFPDLKLLPGLGYDGQMFYVIAREPMHPTAAEPYLDRPRYRLQRQLFPWLAWALHPTGGGEGLVWAMFVVGVLGLFVGSVAFGSVAAYLGAPAWLAAAFPILPGSYTSLRVSTADVLALALALTAIALSLRRRRWAAVIVGVAAVLAKEPVLLVLVGFALWRRDRDGWLLAGVPALAGGAVAAALLLFIHQNGEGVREFTLPFFGLAPAASDWWLHGNELGGLVAAALAFAVGVAALVRVGLRHPLGWTVALLLAFATVYHRGLWGLNLASARSHLPLTAIALLALLTPRAAETTVSSPHAARASSR